MDDRNTLDAILAGATPDENSIDVLHLCLSALTAKLARSDAIRSAGIFYDELRLMGEILCPIFTPVKPPDYVAGMTSLRMEYRGIASDPEMQRTFAYAVRDAAYEGNLESLQAAISARLWERLQGGAVA